MALRIGGVLAYGRSMHGRTTTAALVFSLCVVADALGQARPEETEVWEPVPPVIAPAEDALDRGPPADALVLFDGRGLAEWVNTRDGNPAGWHIDDGVMVVDKAAGNIETRQRFRDYELHLE